MNIDLYNYTVWSLCCSTQLSAVVWKNPVTQSPLGTPLTVFNIIAPISVLLFATWFITGFFYFGWKVPLLGFLIGTIVALVLESLTKAKSIVYTPAVIFGITGIILSIVQICVD